MQPNNPIEEVLTAAMRNLRSIADVNTVIGKPFYDGSGKTVIPISKVTIGFVAGGGEYGEAGKYAPEYPFAGGSGGAVQLSPVGFLVSEEDGLRMIDVDSDNSLNRMFDAARNLFRQANEDRPDESSQDAETTEEEQEEWNS